MLWCPDHSLKRFAIQDDSQSNFTRVSLSVIIKIHRDTIYIVEVGIGQK